MLYEVITLLLLLQGEGGGGQERDGLLGKEAQFSQSRHGGRVCELGQSLDRLFLHPDVRVGKRRDDVRREIRYTEIPEDRDHVADDVPPRIIQIVEDRGHRGLADPYDDVDNRLPDQEIPLLA